MNKLAILLAAILLASSLTLTVTLSGNWQLVAFAIYVVALAIWVYVLVRIIG